MLENLIGAQIISIDESSIEVKLNDSIYTIDIETDHGDCCGYAEFKTNMFYSENDIRNPVITDVQLDSDGDDYYCETSVLTFYGESKALASVESEAGSGSGWGYGAVVSIRCKSLDIDEELASW